MTLLEIVKVYMEEKKIGIKFPVEYKEVSNGEQVNTKEFLSNRERHRTFYLVDKFLICDQDEGDCYPVGKIEGEEITFPPLEGLETEFIETQKKVCKTCKEPLGTVMEILEGLCEGCSYEEAFPLDIGWRFEK